MKTILAGFCYGLKSDMLMKMHVENSSVQLIISLGTFTVANLLVLVDVTVVKRSKINKTSDHHFGEKAVFSPNIQSAP